MDNRGKLNIQEFHVAMGLIYRCKLTFLRRDTHLERVPDLPRRFLSAERELDPRRAPRRAGARVRP